MFGYGGLHGGGEGVRLIVAFTELALLDVEAPGVRGEELLPYDVPEFVVGEVWSEGG